MISPARTGLPPTYILNSTNRRSGSRVIALIAAALLVCTYSYPVVAYSQTPAASVLISILITPANPSVSVGKTQQFKATGTFTGGTTRDLTPSVTWTSSKTAVATVSNTGSPRGLATALTAGTTTIKAAHGTINATTVLTVAAVGPTLVSITVSPAAPAIAIGTHQQFTATGTYTDGSTQDLTETAAWSTSAPSIANISTSGLASTVASGQATIAAAVGAINGLTSLTISQFTHVYVAFPPPAGINNAHFMDAVLSQNAIEGVAVPVQWATIETSAPGAGTCSPVGTDTCQQDAFGWTHTYDWTAADAVDAQWFTAQSGTKKVNIILFGMTGASSVCSVSNSCFNRDTPYYVTTSGWAAHTAANIPDVLNTNKDACSGYAGAATASMSRDKNGLVTVTETGHGYQNGDILWVGRSTPASYNIAQEKITNVKVIGSILTITVTNSLPVGTVVTFHGLRKATFLNGKTVTLTSSTPTTFSGSFSHANYGPTAETGGTASPQGVLVQNATADTFQYQSGILTADVASVPGTVVSTQQSWVVPYEVAYKTAWEAFIAAAIAHFNGSPNLPQISYMRIGRSVGGEAYPYCTDNLALLPSPNTYSKSLWLDYYGEIGDFIESQNPKMLVMDPLNEADTPPDPSYGTAEADSAVLHHNALGIVNGFGSQGLRGNDITNFGKNPPAFCASDWCGTFDTYYQSEPFLELQQRDLSDPIGLTGSLTGDLRPLLPFAVERHATVIEIYALDALLAFDPNYCVLNVPDTGVCATGSVSIAPTDQPPTNLPKQDQYPFFQAVGQPGQAGATGDGSYGSAITSSQGSH
jgi:hypothetical protein